MDTNQAERHWILQQFETIAWQSAESILEGMGIEKTRPDYARKLYGLQYVIYHKLKELEGVE